MIINDSVIDSEEVIAILAPLYKTISFDSESTYLDTKSCFTKEQQLMFAADCYQAEVNNGGHDQFFFNSTGIVWKDTLKALEVLGDQKAYSIFLEAVSFFENASPSLIEEKRQIHLELLEEKNVNFEELDNRFYEEVQLDEKIIEYIRISFYYKE